MRQESFSNSEHRDLDNPFPEFDISELNILKQNKTTLDEECSFY